MGLPSVETTKICIRCGTEYTKTKTKQSWLSWKRRQFCGRKCAAEAMWEERRTNDWLSHSSNPLPLCACGCGQKVASRECRYIKAHKPKWRDITRHGYVRVWEPGHP